MKDTPSTNAQGKFLFIPRQNYLHILQLFQFLLDKKVTTFTYHAHSAKQSKLA
jgi:hypothetical protein